MKELMDLLQEPAFIAVYFAAIALIIVSVLTAKEKDEP